MESGERLMTVEIRFNDGEGYCAYNVNSFEWIGNEFHMHCKYEREHMIDHYFKKDNIFSISIY